MIPVLTADEMRQLEREAIASGRVSSLELQERAARGAASLVPPGVPVEVVAGPGNNGGDALAVARLLKERGESVRVWALAPEPGWKGDAAIQAERWDGVVGFAQEPAREIFKPGSWFIDGMFGLSANRPLEGVALAWRDAFSDRIVLALDQPSWLRPDGVDGEGPAAAVTACFGALKPCHALEPSRSRCGEVHLVDLGLDITQASHWIVDAPLLPDISWNAHKRGRGHVAIRAGSLGMSGAAVLAALGALRAGAGLVTVLADAEIRAEIACQIPEAMVRPWTGLIPDGVDVLLAGPGGVSEIPAWSGPLVLDASALREGEGPRWMARAETILTPHPGEFARLFGLPKQRTTKERLDQARAIAAGPGVCLLKGAQSLITGGGLDETWINDTGHWGLATGGTGDFLAGMVAGLRAQGLGPREAAASGAWLHGAAADRLGKGPLLPRDLAEELPRLMRELYA
ncbi:MAG TPA: NAD(P)H-hydrate dehydratase [Holophagaceae bacterium]|nr:NAD(P)H-hydrate dehydratase [Holophagaceae bacterium]